MKKPAILITVCLAVAVLLATIVGIYYKVIRGAWTAFQPPLENIADLIDGFSTTTHNATDFPLGLPPGFTIFVAARDVPGARALAYDGVGNLWVSETSRGVITTIKLKDGKETGRLDALSGLKKPHGLALDARDGLVLYFVEEQALSRIRLDSDGTPKKLVDLPKGGRHSTRTIKFGPDGNLYVSIGSSCDVCEETDERYAAIYRYNISTREFSKFASGLRNSVFFDWNPRDGTLWAADMGRDFLGDDDPPDELNIVREGGNYGWPICYGKNVHDAKFDKKTYIQNPCQEPSAIPSHIDIPAHSSPLGMAFIGTHPAWPQEFHHSLLVALHGSWNRTDPIGYKIVRIKFDTNGEYKGIEDFIAGWLTKDGKTLGRPVDLLLHPSGFLYVSDDKANVIYGIAPPVVIADQKVKISEPAPSAIATSPLRVAGQARGNWFFEGAFPLQVLDANGKVLGTATAAATGDWMSETLVPFSVTISFSQPGTSSGFLVLKRDNPSGLPQNDEVYKVPIRFNDDESGQTSLGGCRRTGCSGQVCSDRDEVTDCMYRPEYICYAGARCERWPDGRCGWVETVELKKCITESRQ